MASGARDFRDIDRFVTAELKPWREGMKNYSFKDVDGVITDPAVLAMCGIEQRAEGIESATPSRPRGKRAILAATTVKQPNRTVSCEAAREISKQLGTRVFWRRPGAGDTAEILED